MALLLGVGYGVYKIKAQVLLIGRGRGLTGILGWILGYSWKDMERGIVEGITQGPPGDPDHARPSACIDRRLDGLRHDPDGRLLWA
ncbi:MAG: hypothetical protein MZV49_13665 [Rhodopseudomonas palustris]|nr:hypothetical protein [Rhodopseudomonas palustris]